MPPVLFITSLLFSLLSGVVAYCAVQPLRRWLPVLGTLTGWGMFAWFLCVASNLPSLRSDIQQHTSLIEIIRHDLSPIAFAGYSLLAVLFATCWQRFRLKIAWGNAMGHLLAGTAVCLFLTMAFSCWLSDPVLAYLRNHHLWTPTGGDYWDISASMCDVIMEWSAAIYCLLEVAAPALRPNHYRPR